MTSAPVRYTSPVLVLVGPTAIGKTELALTIARRYGCEVVSMDSMQVYRYMNIGTAKPTPEEQRRAKHHLIDLVNPDDQYNAARFVADCVQVIEQLDRKGKIPLITGGTGLYLSALLNGLFDEIHVNHEVRLRLREKIIRQGAASLHRELAGVDPESAARIHPNDRQRILRGLEIYYSTGQPWSELLARQQRQPPPIRFDRLLQIGLTCERSELYDRIARRTQVMLEQQGLVDEVRALRQMGYSAELSPMQAIGYAHANRFLDGLIDEQELSCSLIRDTRRYAKRQLTWFRGQASLNWFERTRTTDVLNTIDRFLDQQG